MTDIPDAPYFLHPLHPLFTHPLNIPIDDKERKKYTRGKYGYKFFTISIEFDDETMQYHRIIEFFEKWANDKLKELKLKKCVDYRLIFRPPFIPGKLPIFAIKLEVKDTSICLNQNLKHAPRAKRASNPKSQSKNSAQKHASANIRKKHTSNKNASCI